MYRHLFSVLHSIPFIDEDIHLYRWLNWMYSIHTACNDTQYQQTQIVYTTKKRMERKSNVENRFKSVSTKIHRVFIHSLMVFYLWFCFNDRRYMQRSDSRGRMILHLMPFVANNAKQRNVLMTNLLVYQYPVFNRTDWHCQSFRDIFIKSSTALSYGPEFWGISFAEVPIVRFQDSYRFP